MSDQRHPHALPRAPTDREPVAGLRVAGGPVTLRTTIYLDGPYPEKWTPIEPQGPDGVRRGEVSDVH